MRAALIQLDVSEPDKTAAMENMKARVRGCMPADLILLPEMWNLGFMRFDRYLSEAQDKNGPFLEAVRGMALETGSYLYSGSFVEREQDGYYNSSYLVSPSGALLANYRKIHLFGFNSRETEILTPGREVTVVKTPLGTMGMATCYDLRFPELFRAMADRGAEIFLIGAAWAHLRLAPWVLLNQARALENQCFLLSVNCAGVNGRVRFAGHSMMVDPWGEVLAKAGDEPAVVTADIDVSRAAQARREFPALADRVDWLKAPV